MIPLNSIHSKIQMPTLTSNSHALETVPATSHISDLIPVTHHLTEGRDRLAPSGWGRTDTTSDSPDLIMADRGTWSMRDTIDGGGGYDTIRGFIPGSDAFDAFAPTVHNVERAELMADGVNGTLDLSNWTGLKYLEVDGSLEPGLNAEMTFFNIKSETTSLAVNDFQGPAVHFNFVPGAENQTENLYLSNVGFPGNATSITGLDDFKQLNIHASGNDYVAMHLPSHVVIDGSGNLTLDFSEHGRQAGLTLDAFRATGDLHLIREGDHSDTIILGSGHDTYDVTHLENLSLTTIKNFQVGQDHLDVHNNNVVFDHHSMAQLDSFGSLKDVAEFVAKQNGHTGQAMVDVFEWHGSTYVFADQNGDHQVNLTDGFIKLDGVDHVGADLFGHSMFSHLDVRAADLSALSIFGH